jgi:hypothetical protein
MTRVSDTRAMIAGMQPELVGGDVVFATLDRSDPRVADAVATMREAEGLSVILRLEDAGPAEAAAFRQITLNVHSALEGVGLTAAVASALAEAGIPANVVAGHHHDHVFVPSAMAERAIACLEALSAGARRTA